MPARAFGRRPRVVSDRAPAPVQPGPSAVPSGAESSARAPGEAAPRAGSVSALRRYVPASAAIAEVVARIHPIIIKSLDMSKIAGLDNEALATQLLGFLETSEAQATELSPLDRQRVVTQLVHDIKGLGPIEPLLHDPDVSDILVNGMSSAYVERRGRLEPVEVRFRDPQHLLHIAQRIAGSIGR